DQFAEVFPERIFEDVCNDDTLFAVHGSAAGAGAGPDGEAVNGADVGFGEAGSGAVAEVPAVLIQKEEGTKETGNCNSTKRTRVERVPLRGAPVAIISRSRVWMASKPSVRLRWVRSRTILEAPMMLPARSLTGEIVRETWRRQPS